MNNSILKYFLLIILTCFLKDAKSQNFKSISYSLYEKYNTLKISPNTAQKHVLSINLRTLASTFSPSPIIHKPDSIIRYGPMNVGFGIGYHYIFLKSKKLFLSKKNRFEFSGFNLYLNSNYVFVKGTEEPFGENLITNNKKNYTYSQAEVKTTVCFTTLSFRRPNLSIYFLNEFGISLFIRNTEIYKMPGFKKIKPYFTFDPIKFRIKKSSIFFTSTVNLALSNSLLKQERINANLSLGLQIFFAKFK